MAYRIKRGEHVGEAARRVASEQCAKALEALDVSSDDAATAVDAVHTCRKHCKKVRGVARFVRPSIGDSAYRSTNDAVRDAARELSPFRDAHAVLATFDAAVRAGAERVPRSGLADVRAELVRRADEASEALLHGGDAVGTARRLLVDASETIGDWTVDDDDWGAIAGGVAKTYGRAVDALEGAIDAPTAENFHEFRKRVKYTWFHVRLLASSAPSVLGPAADRLHDLSGALGDAHDLAVLRSQLDRDPAAFGDADDLREATALLDGHRAALERAGVGLGLRLFAEPADRWSDRLGRYWEVWRAHGAEPTPGGLEAMAPEPDDDLDELTVAELRSRAATADIAGRSKMRRDDLLGALRAAAEDR